MLVIPDNPWRDKRMTSQNIHENPLAENANDVTENAALTKGGAFIQKIEEKFGDLFSDNPFMRSDYGLGIPASYGPACEM
jgi:hypothetical protein